MPYPDNADPMESSPRQPGTALAEEVIRQLRDAN